MGVVDPELPCVVATRRVAEQANASCAALQELQAQLVEEVAILVVQRAVELPGSVALFVLAAVREDASHAFFGLLIEAPVAPRGKAPAGHPGAVTADQRCLDRDGRPVGPENALAAVNANRVPSEWDVGHSSSRVG
jgi:hypothetical protein